MTNVIRNLPYEVLEKIQEIPEVVLASSSFLFTGNVCHTYQTLRKVNTRFRVLVQRLKGFLQRLHISGLLRSFFNQPSKSFKKVWPFMRFIYRVEGNLLHSKVG